MRRHRLGPLALAAALACGAQGALAQSPREGVSPPEPAGELSVPYPEAGQGQATVSLELVVTSEGGVGEVAVLTGDEPFASAALEAARRWRFQPARRDGMPVPARIRLQVRFEPPPPPAEPAPASAPSSTSGTAAEQPIEVSVRGTREAHRTSLSRAEVRELPGAFGDPFRAIEVLPGVTPIASGLPYFFVRGAPPGNVGYFIDGIRVPGLYHLAVGPSVIHPAFVERVELHQGPYPARYGHFAGGVVAGHSAPPSERLRGEANLRLVDAGGMVEAPLPGGRGAIAAAGRYSYTAALLSLLVPDLELGYWDYQARGVYRARASDTISVFAFGSHDFAAQRDRGQMKTIFDVTFHRLALGFGRDLGGGDRLRLGVVGGVDTTIAEEQSFTVEDRSVATYADFEHRLTAGAMLRVGTEARLDAYDAAVTGPLDPGDEFLDEFEQRFAPREEVTLGAYVEAVLEPERGIRLTPGLRVDSYAASEQHFGLAPRLTAEFDVTEDVMLRHGLGIAHQPPSFAVPVPGLQPDASSGLQTALQSSAGVVLDLGQDVEASATLFQSVFLDMTDALGVSRMDNGDPTLDQTSRSLGSARGLEIAVRRSLSRKLGGFLSYTLSRSERALGRAEGPSTFDRTHVLNLALALDLGRGYRAGARFTGYSGIPGDVALVEAARTPPRTPPFYRVDWRVEKRWAVGTEGAFWSLVLEVLNTTLQREVLNTSCNAHVCREQVIGPVTIPSLGLEASF